MKTGLLFEPAVAVFSPTPTVCHMHVMSFADSAACTKTLFSFDRLIIRVTCGHEYFCFIQCCKKYL